MVWCQNLKSLPAEISHLTALTSLHIRFFYELAYLPQELQKLTSLTSFTIAYCNIKCLPVIGGTNNSSLLDLKIEECWEPTSVSEELQYLTSLQRLEIRSCRQLELVIQEEEDGFRHLISLEKLVLDNLSQLTALPEGIQHLPMLKTLQISRCENLTSVSEGLRYLSSLQLLEISDCQKLELVTQEEEEDFQHLISLQELDLENLPQLTALPEGIQRLPMFKTLRIWRCGNLRLLPEWLKRLTTLQTLKIGYPHPHLKARCEKDKGEDWRKISHIPDVNIYH